jgi:hypothetical protein
MAVRVVAGNRVSTPPIASPPTSWRAQSRRRRRSGPQRILVADIVTKDQGATAAINKSRIWRGVWVAATAHSSDGSMRHTIEGAPSAGTLGNLRSSEFSHIQMAEFSVVGMTRFQDLRTAVALPLRFRSRANVRAGVWQNERRSDSVTFAWKSHRPGCNFFH